jgi:diketogulonate reductase-like aldo/keto reductase
LTANPEIVNSSLINQLSKKYNKTKEQVFYKFLNELGIIPLNGTTSNEHMKLDLNIKDFNLEKAEIETINNML